jgi:hypothetical protein
MNNLEFLKPISLKKKSRLGPDMDGGYVVYDPILKETDVLVTYGVGWDVRFETHFNEITGRNVIMFDPTMFGKYILDFKFFKKLLFNGRIRHLAEYLHFVWLIWKDKNELRKRNIILINEGLGITKGSKYDTFESHLMKFQLSDKQVLMKVDIEGDEYRVFENPDIYKHMKNVNQIIIEFHNLHELFPRFQIIMNRLKEDYEIIHIHGNNWGGEFSLKDEVGNKKTSFPKVLEVTLVQKGRIISNDIVEESVDYPTENLDYPNNPDSKDISLNFIQEI